MLATILVLIVIGLIAGFIARAIVPGDDSMSIGATIALGIVGSFIGGLIASALDGRRGADFHPVGILGSIVGAVIVLLLLRVVRGRRGARR